jgi:hypothetical protein
MIHNDIWDDQEKQMELSLAKIQMLREKAMNLALDLDKRKNIPIDEKYSLTFLLEMSIGDNTSTRLHLREIIGQLLREGTRLFHSSAKI